MSDWFAARLFACIRSPRISHCREMSLSNGKMHYYGDDEAELLPRKPKDHRRQCIRIASDCEGIGSIHQVMALMQRRAPKHSSKLRWSQVAMSELDSTTRAVWSSNCKNLPQCSSTKIFESCVGRDMKLMPNHDFYCNGFPCSSISCQGKRDADANPVTDDLLFAIIEVLAAKKPRCWMVENVANLAKQFKHLLQSLIEGIHLACVDHRGQRFYSIRIQILNARVHGRKPQNRERIFIIGLERRYLTSQRRFRWPNPCPMQNILTVLDPVGSLPGPGEVWKGKENVTTALNNFIGSLEQIEKQNLDADQCVADLGGGWEKRWPDFAKHRCGILSLPRCYSLFTWHVYLLGMGSIIS